MGQRRYQEEHPGRPQTEPVHQVQEPEKKTTEKKFLVRAPAFLGMLLLLYTLAAGLWIQYSGHAVEPGAIRQHSIVGILAAATCIVALLISVWQRKE